MKITLKFGVMNSTVKELIDFLKTYPDDTLVLGDDFDTGLLHNLSVRDEEAVPILRKYEPNKYLGEKHTEQSYLSTKDFMSISPGIHPERDKMRDERRSRRDSV